MIARGSSAACCESWHPRLLAGGSSRKSESVLSINALSLPRKEGDHAPGREEESTREKILADQQRNQRSCLAQRDRGREGPAVLPHNHDRAAPLQGPPVRTVEGFSVLWS